MEPGDKLLFLFARQELTEEHRQAITRLASQHGIDWELFFSTAARLGVAPLAYSLLRQHPELELAVPDSVMERVQLYVSRLVWREVKRVQQVTRAIDYFQSQSIDVMLIKGAALSLSVYDCPWHTVSDDVDIILKRRRQALLEEEITRIVSFLHRTGIEFDFYEHHDVNMNGALAVDFDWIWHDAIRAQYGGRDVLVMCPEDLLISLCVNSCRKRFFRLKSLCDIAETVRKNPNLNWEGLGNKAQHYGCQNIVYAALLVTGQTVGGDLPEGALAELGVSRARARLIQGCANFLLERLALASHLSGRWSLMGRKVDLSLMLPYATYSPGQVARRMGEIQRAWARRRSGALNQRRMNRRNARTSIQQ